MTVGSIMEKGFQGSQNEVPQAPGLMQWKAPLTYLLFWELSQVPRGSKEYKRSYSKITGDLEYEMAKNGHLDPLLTGHLV